MKPHEETWKLSTVTNGYECVPDTPEQAAALSLIGAVKFRAMSVGRTGGGPQVAIIPLDESSEAHGRLVACAPEMARMLLSQITHVSHGGPTRAEAKALLKRAGVL